MIPSVIGLDIIFRLGEMVDIMLILNFTIYIAFSLLILIYYLVKQYEMKEKYQQGILKSQVLLEIFLTGTTVFYYVFFLLSGMMYRFLMPFIAASCFFYIPLLFSYKKRLFSVSYVKNTIFVNSLLLSGFIVLIPTIVGLDLLRLGVRIDLLFIIVLSLALLFAILKFLDFVCIKFKILEKIIKHLKLLETISWLFFSLFTSFLIFPYILTDLSLSTSFFIFFMFLC
jgi:hypothetical protein